MINVEIILGLITIAAGLALAHRIKALNSRQARKIEARVIRREHIRK